MSLPSGAGTHYATVERLPGLSVCFIHPLHAATARWLLWARRPEDIDRLLHGRQAGGQQQLRRSTARSSKYEECHVVS